MSMLLNGVSGLNAANSALGAVSQNVANAAVKGYSRQTVYLETAAGGLNGVKVTKIDRIVNSFLNDDIWRTSADTGYYEGFQNYIKKYQSTPNNNRLKAIIEDIVKSGKIQKDDLTIVVIDGK